MLLHTIILSNIVKYTRTAIFRKLKKRRLFIIFFLLQFKRPTAKLGIVIALFLSRLERTRSLIHKIFLTSLKPVKFQVCKLRSVSFGRHFHVCSCGLATAMVFSNGMEIFYTCIYQCTHSLQTHFYNNFRAVYNTSTT